MTPSPPVDPSRPGRDASAFPLPETTHNERVIECFTQHTVQVYNIHVQIVPQMQHLVFGHRLSDALFGALANALAEGLQLVIVGIPVLALGARGGRARHGRLGRLVGDLEARVERPHATARVLLDRARKLQDEVELHRLLRHVLHQRPFL